MSGTLDADDALVVMRGGDDDELLGHALAVTDYDGDGYGDVFAGAPGYDGMHGAVRMYAAGSVEQNILHGDYMGDNFGWSVAVAEWNGGAVREILVGAPYYGAGSYGRAFRYVGASGYYPEGSAYGAAEGSVDGSPYVTGIGWSVASVDSMDAGIDSDGGLFCGTEGVCAYFEQLGAVLPWSDTSGADAIIDGGAGALVAANGGDIDGDGYGDFVLGDPEYQGLWDPSPVGEAYVFLGEPGFSDRALADADHTLSAVAGLGTYGGELGHVVATADVNADGKSDILVTAPNEGLYPITEWFGRAYVFAGPLDPLAGTIDLANADALVDGDDANDWTGYTVAGIGDVNCDGIPDMATGGVRADEAATSTGAVYVFFGPSPGSDALAWKGSALVASDADVVIYGGSADDWVGNNIAALGDMDDDGCDDFAVAGAGSDASGSNAGAVYLFYGDTGLAGTMSVGDADAEFRGVTAADSFGVGLRGGSDFDRDGITDMIVGAPYADVGALVDAGAAYVFLGRSGGDRWSGTYSASVADCTIQGVVAGGLLGWSFATGFSFDAPYFGLGDDVAIGAPLASNLPFLFPERGIVYLFYGDDGGFCSGTVSASTADARIVGQYAQERAGWALAGGLVDEAGAESYGDLAIGAPRPATGVGNVYLVPGRSGFTGTYTAPASGVSLCSTSSQTYRLGWSVAMADVNGIGADDEFNYDGGGGHELIVGAPYGPGFTIGSPMVGFAFAWHSLSFLLWENDGLCHGLSTASVTMSGESIASFAGWSVAALGDLNQDGESDIGVGAWGADYGQGTAYVVLSSH